LRRRRRRLTGFVSPEVAYFATVYPVRTRTGELTQSSFDRMRDAHLARLARRFAHGVNRPRLLDVGCGYGYVLERLTDRFEAYGMDISPHAVEIAEIRATDGAVAVGDIERGIPFDGPFDVVLAVNILEHLRDPGGGIDEIVDALAPGGTVIVHLPTINNAVTARAYRALYENDPTHVYRPSGREIRAAFERRGLSTIRESYWPHAPVGFWRHVRLHPAYLAVFRT
jgi:SAM-dependent methyltransferase